MTAYATFNRFEIELTEDEAHTGYHQGQCNEDVAWLVSQPHISAQLDKIDAKKIKEELSEYGAWEDDELADDDANRARIVWLACGDICDQEAR